MKNKGTIISIGFSLLFFFGCKTPALTVAGNYNYKTECLGSRLDGTLALKAWGNGSNETEALKQAKKNALEAVLFRGILDGKSDCDTKPLLTEVNVQEKNKSYFDAFFSDKGEYVNFIHVEKTDKKTVIMSSGNKITVGLVVTVLKSDLKDRMIRDLITK
jgi:hypothetical protein